MRPKVLKLFIAAFPPLPTGGSKVSSVPILVPLSQAYSTMDIKL